MKNFLKFLNGKFLEIFKWKISWNFLMENILMGKQFLEISKWKISWWANNGPQRQPGRGRGASGVGDNIDWNHTSSYYWLLSLIIISMIDYYWLKPYQTFVIIVMFIINFVNVWSNISSWTVLMVTTPHLHLYRHV